MDISKSLLEQIHNNMTSVRDIYQSELENSPVGYLSKYKVNKSNYYRQIISDNGKKEMRGITKDQALINALARKELLTRTLVRVENNIAVIEKCLAKYQNIDPNTIIPLLSNVYSELPLEAFSRSAYGLACLYGDADTQARIERHRAWSEAPYKRLDYPYSNEYITTDGVQMRSKNEMFVAEKLIQHGILYKYEKELVLNGVTVHPDFTVQKKNMTEMYIEVCGMMDTPRYFMDYKRKRELYESCSIAPWNGNILYICFNGNEADLRVIDHEVCEHIVPYV